MKEKTRLLVVISTYSATLLAAALMGIAVLIYKAPKPQKPVTETVIHTEYIYVWATPETTVAEFESEPPAQILRIVREYNGRIGIFSEKDELLEVINVYTKTLPETDRRLLREGIIVTSEQELRGIIEDYSD